MTRSRAEGILKTQGQKVREAIFLYRVTDVVAPGICVRCTTILEEFVHGSIFDTGGKSTQLISIQHEPFHYVYMGVMMSGMIPENGRMGERGWIGICHQEPDLADRVKVEERA